MVVAPPWAVIICAVFIQGVQLSADNLSAGLLSVSLFSRTSIMSRRPSLNHDCEQDIPAYLLHGLVLRLNSEPLKSMLKGLKKELEKYPDNPFLQGHVAALEYLTPTPETDAYYCGPCKTLLSKRAKTFAQRLERERNNAQSNSDCFSDGMMELRDALEKIALIELEVNDDPWSALEAIGAIANNAIHHPPTP